MELIRQDVEYDWKDIIILAHSSRTCSKFIMNINLYISIIIFISRRHYV